ncbi:unnamed protein product, partial [Discosporangium mesarthrocarpum]
QKILETATQGGVAMVVPASDNRTSEGRGVEGGAPGGASTAGDRFSTADLCRGPDSWGLSIRLLPHQRQALGWARALVARGLGGFISDDPGTGQTVTAAAAVAWVASSRVFVERERVRVYAEAARSEGQPETNHTAEGNAAADPPGLPAAGSPTTVDGATAAAKGGQVNSFFP